METEAKKDKLAERQSLARNMVLVFIGLICVAALYGLSSSNYLLFHSLAEVFSIIVAFAIFAIAWNSRRFLDNGYFLFIGIAFLFIGGLDLVHTLAYKGMGVFQGYGTNLATQLWIAARYVESLSLLAAPLFIRRKLPTNLVFSGYFLAIALLLISIFYWGSFPQSYVEGVGLTPFKVISEYVISFILLGSIGLLVRKRKEFGGNVVKLLVTSMAVTIASEMAFTLYVDVYGVANLIGHLLKIVAFYLIYKALIEIGLTKPYDLLFHGLKESETGLKKQATELIQVNDRLVQEATDRKKAEEKIKQLNESLAQRAVELEASNQELEAFSYSVSHDLRAPLRGMSGFSQILMEDYAEKLDEQAKQYLTGIHDSSILMGQLIDDLLKLSRVNREELHQDRVDLGQLATEVSRTLEKLEPERKVEFMVASNLTGYGDSRLLRIVLENLLSNARKFSSKVKEPRIEMGIIERNGEKAYFVRDNGTGFDMKYADKLFKPFQRLHTHQDFPGTGIGLATVQRIIHRHGGQVWAEGQPGLGATFYFTLK